MSITSSLGLTLTYPSSGERGWYAAYKTFMDALSAHDHSGGGKGLQIGSGGIAANAITGSQFRLASGTWLRSRNNAASGDVNLIRSNTSDLIEFGASIASIAAGSTVLSANSMQSAGGSFNVGTTDGSSLILTSNSTGRFALNSSGDLNGDAASGGHISILRSGKFFQTAAVQSWVPTVLPDVGTLGAVTVKQAKWERKGAWNEIKLGISFTVTSGSPSLFTISAPASGVSDGAGSFYAGVIAYAALSTRAPLGFWAYDGTNITIAVYDSTPAANGNTVTIFIDGKYRAV